MEKAKKRPGPKRVHKNGAAMVERVGVSLTTEELQILQAAMELSERKTLSEYVRSVVVPHAREMVTAHRLTAFAEMVADPKRYAQYIMDIVKANIPLELEKISEEDAAKIVFETMSKEIKNQGKGR